MQRQGHQPQTVDRPAPDERVDLAVEPYRRRGQRVPEAVHPLDHGGRGHRDRQRAARPSLEGGGAVGEDQAGDGGPGYQAGGDARQVPSSSRPRSRSPAIELSTVTSVGGAASVEPA